ncbi:M3 family metallopeptidase [Chitinimonas sp.]|uniref:M3 family metallopeptidase n=1 Tax=Chitinimonas sp. TaxID=1934313 RepID=UPI0035AF8D20
MSKLLPALLGSLFLLSAAPAFAAAVQNNPLLQASPLPFGMPQFDKIKTADFAPAFTELLGRHSAAVAKIASNGDAPSFDNTIVAMERANAPLAQLRLLFGNLVTANGNDELNTLRSDLAPLLAAHDDEVNLNSQLFARIDALYQQRASLKLDAESARLLERYHDNFVRAGVKLSDSDKARIKAINAELAKLQTRFTLNVQKDSNESAILVDARVELAGLSDAEIAAAADAAKEHGKPGKYLVALINTTGQPTVDVLENRKLRQRIFEASIKRGSHGGEFDNREIVRQQASLRAERAKLLGYANHAAYSLADQMAKTPEAANKLLTDIASASLVQAKREAADIQAEIDKAKGGFTLAPWDWGYYTEKVRKARFDYSDTQLKPYFELDRVLKDGVFYAATKLYGIRFKERRDLPVYQADVRVFEVIDHTGKPLALFLLDPFARDNKQGGAWMNEYIPQSTLLGTRPVIGNHLNIVKPAPGQPALLNTDDVVTAFHEFGHALHGIFSNVRYPQFAGSNVPRDFVEYPSQFNEMWAFWPEVLQHYARHYKSGAPMPKALLDKVIGVRKFNEGFVTTEYAAAAMLDQRWHQLSSDAVPADVLAFESSALQQAGMDFAPVPPRYRSTYFLHAFSGGGYEGGYYAYLWSDVLATDSSAWFREHGGLNRKNGDWFRQQILSVGDSRDLMGAYRAFRGREPRVDHLLEKRGLK